MLSRFIIEVLPRSLRPLLLGRSNLLDILPIKGNGRVVAPQFDGNHAVLADPRNGSGKQDTRALGDLRHFQPLANTNNLARIAQEASHVLA